MAAAQVVLTLLVAAMLIGVIYWLGVRAAHEAGAGAWPAPVLTLLPAMIPAQAGAVRGVELLRLDPPPEGPEG